MFNRTILITGGTGTLGHALVPRLLQEGFAAIKIYSRDEYKQYLMRDEFPDKRVQFFLGDVRDKERLRDVARGSDMLIHAAAYKRVPEIEAQPFEAVKTNVLGSQNVVEVCWDVGINNAVLVSSDKACEPKNFYGATKMMAERFFLNANLKVVRYGNVIGSRGSVVEIFKKQVQDGAKITVTDPNMTRFFLTIQQAVDLIMFALRTGSGGQIYVPQIPSMKVTDLVQAISPDATYSITGIRAGEKIHEKLIGSDFSNTWLVKDNQCAPAIGDYTSDNNKEWLLVEEIRKMI